MKNDDILRTHTQMAGVRFKLAEADLKSPENAFKIENFTIIHISLNSYHNGLLVGDIIATINGVNLKTKGISALAPIFKGEECVLDVLRAKNAFEVPKNRLNFFKTLCVEGTSLFVFKYTRPRNVDPNAKLGVEFSQQAKRLHVVAISSGLLSDLLWVNDSIIDIDGVPLTKPVSEHYHAAAMKSKYDVTGELNLLIERPISKIAISRKHKSIAHLKPHAESDVVMSADVVAIAKNAKLMHSTVFRKLRPTSILTADCGGPAQQRKKTFVSNASAEVRIHSDVEDESDLKDVVKKSHAVSDNYAFFDDDD